MTWLIISTAITAVFAYDEFKDRGWKEPTIQKIIICFFVVYVGGLFIGWVHGAMMDYRVISDLPRRMSIFD